MGRLDTHKLVVGYGNTSVLGPLDLTLRAEQFVCLIGANGVGKSTLIRTLCGMQRPISGTILLNERDLANLPAKERARHLAVVLTERVAGGALRGIDLVALGRHPYTDWTGRMHESDHRVIYDALVDTDALELKNKLLVEMSDGERQRMMIARAIALQPRILILDEATAFLDLPRRVEFMELLLRLARQRKIAILLSTHDLELALRHADAIWLAGRNRELHVGAPEDLVLDGRFAEAFAADGLAFDLERGELSRVSTEGTPVRVVGSGVPAIWAARALKRIGYAVADDADIAVDVSQGRYRLSKPGTPDRTCATLSELVGHL